MLRFVSWSEYGQRNKTEHSFFLTFRLPVFFRTKLHFEKTNNVTSVCENVTRRYAANNIRSATLPEHSNPSIWKQPHQAANKTGTDQTVWMRRLVRAYLAHRGIKQAFSWFFFPWQNVTKRTKIVWYKLFWNFLVSKYINVHVNT